MNGRFAVRLPGILAKAICPSGAKTMVAPAKADYRPVLMIIFECRFEVLATVQSLDSDRCMPSLVCIAANQFGVNLDRERLAGEITLNLIAAFLGQE